MSLGPLTILTLLLLTGTGLSGLLLWQSLLSVRRNQLPKAFPFFLAGITVWLLAYTWELSTLSLSFKILASKVQYFGIATVPTAWLMYTVSYARLDRQFTPVYRWLLSLEPALITVLVWTNDTHHLIWESVRLVPISADLAAMQISYGPLFPLHVVYSYTLIIWATTLLLRTLRQSSGAYRSHIVTLILSAGAPWLGNMLYLFHRFPPLGTSRPNLVGLEGLWLVDWTPFGFLITGLAVSWGRWRFQLWDTAPIARNALFEDMRDGLLVLDRFSRVVDINPALQDILGLPLSKVMGQPANRILAPWPLLLHQLASGQQRVTHQQQYGASPRWHEVRLSPLFNARNEILGQLLEWRDVTAQKTIEIELARAKDKAESANRAKSHFLATISHEFRTPLSAILGYSELLKEESRLRGYTDLIDDLDTIHSAGSNLLALINNVLEFSKVEAGKGSVFAEHFDVIALVIEVSKIAEPLMQRNKNQLQVDYSEEIQPIYSDPAKIRQILLNILSNAAKFTVSGTVQLSVRPLAQHEVERVVTNSAVTPAPDWIRFQIQDTGIGMSEAQLQRVFEAFVQAEESTSQHYGGTGLGLALSRSFCQMIGGVISVESVPGKGSTFTVDLPTSFSPERHLDT